MRSSNSSGAPASSTPPSGGAPPRGPLRHARGVCRDALFAVVRRILSSEDGRAIAASALKGGLNAGPPFAASPATVGAAVYPDLGVATSEIPPRPRRPIFITARFRSGSTVLWNIFRHVEGCTAYYEPLNERRWFDPQTRGGRTDATHLGVSDYWREYDGLERLAAFYREEWIDRHLYMDESFWDPGLQQYVQTLVDSAPRRPVLQFNRIDFRLAWFRARFPHAHIVHLYRHPRDQWCSSLVDPERFGPTMSTSQFGPYDHFYLLRWARDLRHRFPFLDPASASHPYAVFYFLWKLSYIFGEHYGDVSVCFENLVNRPEQELTRLMRAVDIDDFDVSRLTGCIARQKSGKWREYADDEWFRRHESECEKTLSDFFGLTTRESSGGAAARREPFARIAGG